MWSWSINGLIKNLLVPGTYPTLWGISKYKVQTTS